MTREYVDDVTGEVMDPHEVWTIEDLPTADWALSRLAALEREVADNNHLCKVAVERMLLRTEKLNEKANRGANFFRAKLAQFAEANRETLLGGGKKKTRELLHGSISWRKTGGAVKVVDAKALLAWAIEQPVAAGVIRSKVEPALDEIRRHVSQGQPVPPGCELTPEVDVLSIKTEATT